MIQRAGTLRSYFPLSTWVQFFPPYGWPFCLEEEGNRFVKMLVDCVCNVMAHAQKPDFVFWRNRRVRLNWRGRQFSRLLAANVFASAVEMLDTPCSEVVWRVLATHCIRQFPLHFPSHASPCAITFQLDSTCLSCNSPEDSNNKIYLLSCLLEIHCLFLLHKSTAPNTAGIRHDNLMLF